VILRIDFIQKRSAGKKKVTFYLSNRGNCNVLEIMENSKLFLLGGKKIHVAQTFKTQMLPALRIMGSQN